MSMKPLRVEELAHLHRHAVAQHQVLLHLRAAQVEHAVRRGASVSDRFSSSSWNGGVTRRVQHLELVAQHLDLAALQVGVDGALGARAHQARHLHAELVAQRLGGGEGRRRGPGSHTTCTRPSRSRRSMKITPPWSRRRCTQPIRVTVWPRSASVDEAAIVGAHRCTPVLDCRGRERPRRQRGAGAAAASTRLRAERSPGAQPIRFRTGAARGRRAAAARPRPSR